MKLLRGVLKIGLVGWLCVSAAHAAGSPKAARVEPLELYQQLGADAAAQLATLVERYNATSPKVPVVLRERHWQSGALPDMMILNEADEALFLARKPGARPLHQLMKEAGLALDTFRPPATLNTPAIDSQNRLVGLPITLGTPVVYFNKTRLRRAGLDVDNPPRTWQGWQPWLGALYDKGIRCPYTTSRPVWVLLENTSAWHNEPLTHGGALALNGLLQVKHLALMSSWYKSRYLHIFGRGDEAEEHFASGECAVLTTASSRYPALSRAAKFEVGVAPLPHHEEYFGAPQNTLMDGPALWVVNGKSAAQNRAMADFVSFLLSAESQVELQRQLGALPLNRAGLAATRGELLKDDLASLKVGIATLTHKPATDFSRASSALRRPEIREALNDALEQVWADRKPAKQALDDAVGRTRRLVAQRP